MNPSDRYTRLLAEAEQRLRHIKQRIWRVSMLRVLLFMAGITALIYFFHAAGWVLTPIPLLYLHPVLRTSQTA